MFAHGVPCSLQPVSPEGQENTAAGRPAPCAVVRVRARRRVGGAGPASHQGIRAALGACGMARLQRPCPATSRFTSFSLLLK